MLALISLVVLVLLAALAITLQKTYNSIPLKELKRRAQGGDELAKLLHRAVAYGTSLGILLWLIVGLASGGFFVLLARSVPAWAAFMASLILLWFGFAWLPKSRPSVVGEHLTRWFTPLIAWLLRKSRPALGRLERFVNDRAHLNIHSDLYEKEDLLDLFKNQKKQLDNRITKEELRIATGALSFSDRSVSDVMTPRRMIKMVKSEDSIGPVLLSELHESGHSRFPVYTGKQDNIVGILYLHDLLEIKDKRRVSELMKSRVYYVNEELKLGHDLQAISKTKHHMIVVLYHFLDVEGVISIEDILGQIIGQPIMDEFDKYEDLRAVANLTAEKSGPHRDS